MARARISVAFLVAATTSVGIAAQEPRASFEVASVKPNAASDGTLATENLRRPGGVHFGNAQLGRIIAWAFNLSGLQGRFGLIGGSERLLNARFTINARAPEGTAVEEYPPMMQTLLAERFGLRTRVESRRVSGYALTVRRPGTLGPNLRPSEVDCDQVVRLAREDRTKRASSPQMCFVSAEGLHGGMILRSAGNIGRLTAHLQGAPDADGPLVDATRLGGLFEWELKFRLSAFSPADLPTFRDAVEEQLGLTLTPTTVSIDTLVIESLEPPTPD